MSTRPTPRELAAFLRSGTRRARTVYRPYICPFDRLLSEIPEGARVFDVGCGGGVWLALVSRFRRPSALAGIDVDPVAVREATSLLRAIQPGCTWRLYVGEATQLPEGFQNFDVISMIDVLHHIHADRQAAVLAIVCDSMARGARLLLKDIDADHVLVWANRLHDLILTGAPGHELPLAVAAEMIKRSGLFIEAEYRQMTLWYPHYTVVARKR
jgi:SAM-dependent methyltransferase